MEIGTKSFGEESQTTSAPNDHILLSLQDAQAEHRAFTKSSGADSKENDHARIRKPKKFFFQKSAEQQ
jgi:hypothetical protein